MPCGGHKTSTRSSSYCRLYFISFGIIEPILVILKIEYAGVRGRMQPRNLQCCIWRNSIKPSLRFSWFYVFFVSKGNPFFIFIFLPTVPMRLFFCSYSFFVSGFICSVCFVIIWSSSLLILLSERVGTVLRAVLSVCSIKVKKDCLWKQRTPKWRKSETRFDWVSSYATL